MGEKNQYTVWIIPFPVFIFLNFLVKMRNILYKKFFWSEKWKWEIWFNFLIGIIQFSVLEKMSSLVKNGIILSKEHYIGTFYFQIFQILIVGDRSNLSLWCTRDWFRLTSVSPPTQGIILIVKKDTNILKVKNLHLCFLQHKL